jgi:hypothetical protein
VIYRQKNNGVFMPGQIVSYRAPANPSITITHRVISVRPEQHQVQTKGDALQAADTPIDMQAVRGRAVADIPHFGFILDVVRTPYGLLLFVYLPAFTIIGSELTVIGTACRQKHRYRAPHYRRKADGQGSVRLVACDAARKTWRPTPS